jgi:hypothetical protein
MCEGTMSRRIDLANLDDGIRDSVRMLWKGGFKTFTSCEGGRGHPFRQPTIGVNLVGDYFAFRDRLALFLKSQGCQSFTINLTTCYHPSYRKAKDFVYVEGIDLLSAEKRKRLLASMRRRDQRLRRMLEQLTDAGR